MDADPVTVPGPDATQRGPAVAEAARVPRRRWVGTLIALLFTAALAASAWYLVQRANPPEPAPAAAGGRGVATSSSGARTEGAAPGSGGGTGPAVTVGAAQARLGEMPILIEAIGTVTPVATVMLRPQVSGILTEVLFTEGQLVRKGDLLARIDARPFEQALAQAQGVRARNEAQLAVARTTLERYRRLWKQDSIARQEVDTQAALVKQLEASVQSDRASEQAARLNLGYTRIVAPITGRIGLRAVDPGNMVTAGGTTGIATVTQMAPIDVQFAVPQDRVQDVLAAQRVGTLPVDALDRSRAQTLASGTFSTLDNVVDVATGTIRAKARFDNDDGALFPSQFVNVKLQLGASRGVLVPVTAVRNGPRGAYVYVVDDANLAHVRDVARGGATVDEIQIVQGLKGGETVVTEGGDRVRDGGRVQIAGARSDAEPGASADARR